MTDSVYRLVSVNCFSLHFSQNGAEALRSSSGCKVSKIRRQCNASRGFFVTLPSEAEEETGSAEEQPASNRLSRHTEIVIRSAVSDGGALLF